MQWDFQFNFILTFVSSLTLIIATLYTVTKITIRLAHAIAHFSHTISWCYLTLSCRHLISCGLQVTPA